MSGRSRSFDRCARCCLRPTLCLCAELPALALATRVVLVMHRFEARHTTNTGRLAALALRNSGTLVRGAHDTPAVPADLGAGADAGEALVLFPADDAVELDAALAATLRRPVTLVVPDGNWGQASRAIRREPALAALRRVRLAPGAPSAYRLRQGARPGGLATLEAVARALGVLEGPAVRARLEALFATAVERVLWSRGNLPLAACHGTIPPAAIAEARASGRRRDAPPARDG